MIEKTSKTAKKEKASIFSKMIKLSEEKHFTTDTDCSYSEALMF